MFTKKRSFLSKQSSIINLAWIRSKLILFCRPENRKDFVFKLKRTTFQSITFFPIESKLRMADISSLPKPVDLVYAKYEPSTATESKTPILINHGLMSCKEHWMNLPEQLAEQTKRIVYIFDSRDHNVEQWTEELTVQGIVRKILDFFLS